MIKHINTLKHMVLQMQYILTSKQKKQCNGIFFVIFIGSIFEMLGVTAILPFIQGVLDPKELYEKKYIKPIADALQIQAGVDLIIMVGIGIIIIYIVKNLYLLISSYLQIKFKLRLLKDLSVLMLRTYMKRPYSFFLEINSGDILRGVNNDVYGVYYILENCFKIITEGLAVILIAIFIIITDPIMALGIIGISALCFTVITLGMRKRMQLMGELQRNIFAQQNKHAYQAVNGIKEISVMQRNDAFIDKYDEVYEERRKTDVTYYFAQAVPERIIEGVCISGIIVMVCIRIALGVDISTFVPQLAAFAVAAFRILPSVARLTGYFSGIVFYRPTLAAAYDNIRAAREYEEYLYEYARERHLHVYPSKSSFENELEIRNISWKYAGAESNVIQNLSMTIKKGESVAFIGSSGAGKTTLADIILGLLQPQQGSVYMDGIDIFAIRKEWSQIVGYVPQTVFLLDDTIKNNISFGLKEDEVSIEMVWKALEQAQLREFVESLPNKLDTIVGERGIKFSGGQRQRVAIARALYYNPDILVLDEATSALDSATETTLMEAIEELQGKKTLIIVAHRLSTIQNCDKVYEIRDGKVYLQHNDKPN